MDEQIIVSKSDLLKILDVVKLNEDFHYNRDKMNGAVHLARQVRFSPLTSETIATRERIENILADNERVGNTQ
jgi:hypothetical protein